MSNMKTFIVTLLLLPPLFSFTQKVTNVHFEQVGKQIHIYYNLSGEDTYNVKVYCKTDKITDWGNPLQQVIGAVGKNQKQGANKEIYWDVLAEREKLTGNIRFKIEVSPSVNIKMVFVKGGTFIMGCTSEQNGCNSDEKPAHRVTVDDFYIGKYEITQKQWRDIMGNNPSYFSGCDDCPVENVCWNDVQEFLKKLNEKTGQHYRLPTEAEWEYAARGGNKSKGYQYAGSNHINNVAWYTKNSYYKGKSSHNYGTHKVGTKKANELGIYDMSGNVWEWCNDWYDDNYYHHSLQNNPQGPKSGTRLVLRSGSWNGFADGCRVAYRLKLNPDKGSNYVGFRVVH